MFATPDVVYLLVYSTGRLVNFCEFTSIYVLVVLLNVDQHSPNVKNRMTLDDFTKSITYIMIIFVFFD